jgi:hypothetical protein
MTEKMFRWLEVNIRGHMFKKLLEKPGKPFQKTQRELFNLIPARGYM